MNLNLQIRIAKEQDAENIALLLIELQWFKDIKEENLVNKQQQIRSLIQLLHGSAKYIFIAESLKGEFYGYCAVSLISYSFLTGPEAYIGELFIKERYRGQGIGASILKYIKEFAKNKGCRRIGLLNNKERESYKRKFYEKNGFHERSMVNYIFEL